MPNITAGCIAFAMIGKAKVNDAANTQWVKLPKVVPAALSRLGNISLMNTQITAPCPTACAAMNAKMQ
jgi:xanthine/uracil permease